MTHESHLWIPGQSTPTIRPHTLEKHKLLEAYLARYVATLTQNVKMDRLRLTLIDGFAGGNLYFDKTVNAERPGSPSIIIGAIKEAEKVASDKRRKPFKIVDDYFFIESNRGAFHHLEQTLKDSEYAHRVGKGIKLLNGDFSEHLEGILEFVLGKSKSGRAIFVLDQCGYDKVPFDCIRRILNTVPNAEIILTFAADFLIDYLTKDRPNRRLKSLPDLDLDAIASKYDRNDPRWRKLIQLELHAEVQRFSDAKFYTPFFIHSKDSHRDLWLVHLSRHHRARDVMVGVHWDHQNSFSHYGKPGIRMLGYHQDEDILHTGQPTLPGFYFDEKAKALTKETLYQELPPLIYDCPGTINFKTLFSTISNGTPATSEILKTTLLDLANDHQIIIKDETGNTTRKSGVQHDSDLVYIPRQRHFSFD